MNTRRNTNFIIGVIITMCLTTRGSDGKLVQEPVNTTAAEGERVTLQCATDLELTVFWYFNNEEIFYGGRISMPYASRFAINSSSTKGEYHLVIPHATNWYNGMYKCADDEGEGEKRSAWLTVNDPPTTASSDGADKAKGTNSTIGIGVIVAIVVGTVVAVALVIGIAIWLCKRRMNQTQEQNKTGKPLMSSGNKEKSTPIKADEKVQKNSEGHNQSSARNTHPESGVAYEPTIMKNARAVFERDQNTPAGPSKIAPRRLLTSVNQPIPKTENKVTVEHESATDSLIVSVPSPEPDVQENTTSVEDQDKDGSKQTENKTVDREDRLEEEVRRISLSAVESENQEQKSSSKNSLDKDEEPIFSLTEPNV